MAIGKVKWFNNAKGYGFILPALEGEDLFVHYSSIVMEGYKTLRAGQDVEFEVHEGPKGLHAINIRTPEGALTEAEPGDADTAEAVGHSSEAEEAEAAEEAEPAAETEPAEQAEASADEAVSDETGETEPLRDEPISDEVAESH